LTGSRWTGPRSDEGDSGAGFYRLQSDGYGGYTYKAFGILTGGTPSYTYYYPWDTTFYAKRVGEVCEDNWWIQICTTGACAL
jgi:hypothetical protein